MFMSFHRSPRRAFFQPTLQMELLEDRVVPDGTPGAFYEPDPNVPPVAPPPDAVPVEWLGQTRLAAAGRWIVQVDGLTGTPAEQIVAFDPVVNSLGLGVFIESQLGIDGMFRLAGPADLSPQELLNALTPIAGVQYAEPDFADAFGQVIPNDAEFARLWGMNNTGSNPGVGPGTPDADIDAPEAWDLSGPTRGSTQTIIAIDDSGVDYTHPDLYLNIWLN